jgi:hypothetical protein
MSVIEHIVCAVSVLIAGCYTVLPTIVAEAVSAVMLVAVAASAVAASAVMQIAVAV